MLVDYYFTDDAFPERCEAQMLEATEQMECFFLCKIKKGEKYYQVRSLEDGTIMNMCEDCYRYSCFNVSFRNIIYGSHFSEDTYQLIIDYLIKNSVELPRIEKNEQWLKIGFPSTESEHIFKYANELKTRKLISDPNMSKETMLDTLEYILPDCTGFNLSTKGNSIIIEYDNNIE